MLKLDRTRKIFDRLPTSSFTEAALLERADLQECIWNSSDAFFTEMGERLFVIGKEVLASDSVQDRIDILAIDPEGQAVIVELKRGSNKLQMLQAISYAGMVARWNIDDFRALVSEDEWEALIDFLEVRVRLNKFPNTQIVILITRQHQSRTAHMGLYVERRARVNQDPNTQIVTFRSSIHQRRPAHLKCEVDIRICRNKFFCKRNIPVF